ncbi:MAG: hypothetical protein GF317_20180 [Candidatus Lokiarchaeota archaeon]|nr:hypothetical protein [Candidatus Lokiarchaeota archaeon]MBD3201801.1 hypothetical protein [Candidatus Lokiarchaeota archaeon]
MTLDLSERKIIYRCKSEVAKSGKRQYHFNVPNTPFRSGLIDPDQEYFIYYVEDSPEQHKVITNDIEELQQFKSLLKSKLPFISKIAHPSGQYRIGIPKSEIKNRFIDPDTEKEYWIYLVK